MEKGETAIEKIETQSAYAQALERLSGFFDSPPASGSHDDEIFKQLLEVVEVYEREHFPIPLLRQHHGIHTAATANEAYSVEAGITRVRELHKLYKGPPVTPEQLKAAINYGRE